MESLYFIPTQQLAVLVTLVAGSPDKSTETVPGIGVLDPTSVTIAVRLANDSDNEPLYTVTLTNAKLPSSFSVVTFA